MFLATRIQTISPLCAASTTDNGIVSALQVLQAAGTQVIAKATRLMQAWGMAAACLLQARRRA